MTPENENDHEREEVLTAFLVQCPQPTASQISEWLSRYPQFSSEIAELAADLIDMSLENRSRPDQEPSEEELETARVAMSNLIRRHSTKRD